MLHATIVVSFTRSPWNTTLVWPASGSHQDQRILFLIYSVKWGPCLLHLLPIRNLQHWEEVVDLHSGHCNTTGQLEKVLCEHFTHMLQLFVASYTLLVFLLNFLFSVPPAAGSILSWTSMMLCNSSIQPWNEWIFHHIGVICRRMTKLIKCMWPSLDTLITLVLPNPYVAATESQPVRAWSARTKCIWECLREVPLCQCKSDSQLETA